MILAVPDDLQGRHKAQETLKTQHDAIAIQGKQLAKAWSRRTEGKGLTLCSKNPAASGKRGHPTSPSSAFPDGHLDMWMCGVAKNRKHPARAYFIRKPRCQSIEKKPFFQRRPPFLPAAPQTAQSSLTPLEIMIIDGNGKLFQESSDQKTSVHHVCVRPKKSRRVCTRTH